MGTVQLLHRPLEGTIMKVVIALSLISVAAGAGYLRPRCTKELETITVKKCRLEYDESCASESKVIGQRVTYEKGDCKEVEVCKPAVFVIIMAREKPILAMSTLSAKRSPRRFANRFP